jgi:hypothetical protein
MPKIVLQNHLTGFLIYCKLDLLGYAKILYESQET